MKTVAMIVVVLALGVVSCREAPEVVFQRGMEAVTQMVNRGDTAGACHLLMKMAGEKRLVSRRDELQARFVSCFENHAGRLCAAGGADEVVKQTEVYMKQLPDRVA